jgi:hypothetical protein
MLLPGVSPLYEVCPKQAAHDNNRQMMMSVVLLMICSL